jgi:hypothetical protein
MEPIASRILGLTSDLRYLGYKTPIVALDPFIERAVENILLIVDLKPP